MEAEQGRIPEVGEYVRMFGTLVEVQDVTPKPPPKQVDYIFEDTDQTPFIGTDAYDEARTNLRAALKGETTDGE